MNSVVLVAFRRNIEWTQPHTYRSPCSLRPPPMQAATLGWSSECWTVLSWAFFTAGRLSCPAHKSRPRRREVVKRTAPGDSKSALRSPEKSVEEGLTPVLR